MIERQVLEIEGLFYSCSPFSNIKLGPTALNKLMRVSLFRVDGPNMIFEYEVLPTKTAGPIM